MAAGPVGRQATAGADVTLRSAVYSYSRSRGLFLGLALDGTALLIDNKANAAYYGNTGQASLSPNPPHSDSVPPSAARLLEQVQKCTMPRAVVPSPADRQPAAAPPPVPR